MAAIAPAGPLMVATQGGAAAASVESPRREQVKPTAPAPRTARYGRRQDGADQADPHRGNHVDIRA